MNRMHQTKKDILRVMPEPIARWLTGLSGTDRVDRHMRRAQRFVEYWLRDAEHADETTRAWSKLAAVARDNDSLVALFIVMPDGPIAEPYAAVFGARCIDPIEENRRYASAKKWAADLKCLTDSITMRRLAADASATGAEAAAAYREFADQRASLRAGLSAIETLLELIDAKAKMPSKHVASPNLALKNYRFAVAQLNRYLSSPQHASLSVIARINCQDYPLTADSINKAWHRSKDKTR